MNAPEPQWTDARAARPEYAGESYYGQPAVKQSAYGLRVALYTFLAGLGGAAQLIGTLAEFAGGRRGKHVSRNGRMIAAANGALAGPALLIADLHTPKRWYNMLRIYRRTSPMSLGSYVVTAFGASSAAAAAGAGRIAQIPAAIAGAGMATYTPALLATTATPLWASAPRRLGVEFAAAAFASGAAALALAERVSPNGAAVQLDPVAAAGTVVYGLAAFAAARAHARKRVDGALRHGRWAAVHRAGVGLGVVLPLACYALNAMAGRSERRSVLAATGVLAGVFLSRWALIEAGNASARDPRHYLQLAPGRHE